MARVATAWVISHVPSTFSRMTVRKPFGVMSSAGVRNCPPALFTSRSICPWRSITPSTSDSTWSSSRMSQARASMRPPSAAAAVSSSGSSAPSADDHLGAQGGQLKGGGPPEPGAAARDERYLPGE